MDAPTDRDVLLGLLALDAYTRGNDPAITLRDKDQVGQAILGDVAADLGNDVTLDGAASVGFDAAAYTFNGETIIAYRGTDFRTTFLNLPLTATFARDVYFGWLASFNVFSATEDDGEDRFQPSYAEEFYELVTGDSIFDTASSNVTVTGHSLGGAKVGTLAGAIAETQHSSDTSI